MDFHLLYIPDILDVFGWQRSTSLLSMSRDGSALPDIYGAFDLVALVRGNETDYKPSPVVSINGTDVEEWLNECVYLQMAVYWKLAVCLHVTVPTQIRH